MINSLGLVRIFICTQDINMCKSFDSLRGVINGSMHLDALSGHLFIFKNKRGDRIKAVYWDGDGFAMWYKVLQKGTFQFPDLQNFSSAGIEIELIQRISSMKRELLKSVCVKKSLSP